MAGAEAALAGQVRLQCARVRPASPAAQGADGGARGQAIPGRDGGGGRQPEQGGRREATNAAAPDEEDPGVLPQPVRGVRSFIGVPRLYQGQGGLKVQRRRGGASGADEEVYCLRRGGHAEGTARRVGRGGEAAGSRSHGKEESIGPGQVGVCDAADAAGGRLGRAGVGDGVGCRGGAEAVLHGGGRGGEEVGAKDGGGGEETEEGEQRGRDDK